ncbi:MAG: ABC transporter ATP-binding protein [Hespellia sp.]|nr:ABC transporter ATP-binding protein [Hespellia sp.]
MTSANPAIIFQNVCKKFENSRTNAVDHVDVTIQEGEFITILGSSGCGKTTLLKMVNRLYEPDEGKILLFGEDISTVDAVKVRRRIGYVIQQVGLFPHMTIGENVAVVPKLLKWKKEKIDARVKELLTLVGLEPEEYENRYPSQLSGGQQQRVGLARALAIDPKIMLLDEPFGAIDAINRLNLQDELLRIHGGLGKTFLFVTHDIHEAFKMGDRVIIMNEGEICQFDTPRHIAAHPANDFVEMLIRSAREQEQIFFDACQ